ncbi:hypothetical protein [Novosphingobium rosa]|uniref:hypothetical protein n=1 Tax=Novosphingobium rosa TaxID=76978 RepID=UPI0008320C54|nr:hypothetical protein [Novosphingobium rosa]
MRRAPAEIGLHAAPSLIDVDRPLRLVHVGSDDAVGTRPAARMFVAEDGGPLRTIVGNAPSHWTGEEHSTKTGLSNPYDGATEHALIVESELRADVLTYRTQAFRLQLMVGTTVQQWICDHLRQIRIPGGYLIEAIECKPDLSYIGQPAERQRMLAVKRVIEGMGWKFRLICEKDVRGGSERQLNFGRIYARETAHVTPEAMTAFERLLSKSPVTTFKTLREALSPERVTGEAMAQALICQGRVSVDLDRLLFDGSPVRLLPVISFTPKIWF